jgi:hypothetical protein
MLTDVKPTLDAYDRLVYRAFGVPDSLTPEHQLRAAGAGLLRRCLSNRAADDDYGETTVLSNLYVYQEASTHWIEAAAGELRQGTFDPLLGQYEEASDRSRTPTEARLCTAIFNQAEQTRAGYQSSNLTGNLGMALAREVLIAVMETASAMSALREAQLDLEVNRTHRGW